MEMPVNFPSPVSAGDHVRGARDALVTIIEYGDFQCPNCKQAAPAVALLLKRFEGRLNLVFRHFPLEEVHAHALIAAEAAEAAAVQGRFWEMHDQLFAHQPHLQLPRLRAIAEAIGLDLRRFSQALREHAHVQHIRENAAEGRRLGIRGTPTFYVNTELCDVSFGLDPLEHAVNKVVHASRL